MWATDGVHLYVIKWRGIGFILIVLSCLLFPSAWRSIDVQHLVPAYGAVKLSVQEDRWTALTCRSKLDEVHVCNCHQKTAKGKRGLQTVRSTCCRQSKRLKPAPTRVSTHARAPDRRTCLYWSLFQCSSSFIKCNFSTDSLETFYKTLATTEQQIQKQSLNALATIFNTLPNKSEIIAWAKPFQFSAENLKCSSLFDSSSLYLFRSTLLWMYESMHL